MKLLSCLGIAEKTETMGLEPPYLKGLGFAIRHKKSAQTQTRKTKPSDRICLARAGVLYFGLFLGAPREP